jgi:hypothetical protein
MKKTQENADTFVHIFCGDEQTDTYLRNRAELSEATVCVKCTSFSCVGSKGLVCTQRNSVSAPKSYDFVRETREIWNIIF